MIRRAHRAILAEGIVDICGFGDVRRYSSSDGSCRLMSKAATVLPFFNSRNSLNKRASASC